MTESLQKGLLEEEVNRDLNAAAKAYENAIRQTDAQRRATATAVFRLGEVYRKLGRTNDAVAQYQRVLRDFADQANLVPLARQNLMAAGQGVGGPGAAADFRGAAFTPAAQRQKELLEQELALVEEQLKQKQLQVDAGRTSRDELLALQRESLSLKRQMAALEAQKLMDLLDVAPPVPEAAAPPFAPTVDPADVASLQEEIALVEQELEVARKKLENGKAEAGEVRRIQREVLRLQRKLPDNAPKERQIALLEQERRLTEDSLTEIRRKIEVGAAAPLDENPFRRELMAVQRELAAARRASAPSQPGPPARSDPSDQPEAAAAAATGDPAVTPATKEEADEIKRIQAIIRNSPDLVNARNATQAGGTPLHKAAENGYLAVAEFLLANGADVNATDRSRRSPLHLAAAGGHKRVAELLLAKGADAKGSDYKGFTPFHLAVEAGYLAVSETLLAAGAEVNTRANPGGAPDAQPDWESTPLHAAAEKGFPALVELLLKHGAAIDARDRGGRTPLVRAILKAQPNVVRLLLERGADPNALDASGSSLLFWAAIGKRPPLVQLLLDHQAAVDARISAPDPEGDWTVLFRAVWDGEVELTRLLIEAGANIDARAASGITPVHWAVIKNVPATLKLLIEKKANVNGRDTGGNTPLHYAVEAGSVDFVDILLAAGADPDAPGWTQGSVPPWPPMFKAIVADESVRLPLVSRLLERGADVNARTSQGWTALHWAVQWNLDPIVELLVGNKADVNLRGSRPKDLPRLAERRPAPVAALSTAGAGSARGPGANPTRTIGAAQPGVPVMQPVVTTSINFGVERLPADRDVTALHVAVAGQNLELAKFLLDHGAEIDAPDANGRTPLHLAVDRRDLDLIRLLLDAKADPNAKDSSGRTPYALAATIRDSGQSYFASSVPNRGNAIQAKPAEITELLRERGAKAIVSDPRAISLVRTAAGYQNRLLTRGTNDWNRFTLGELVGVYYGLNEKMVPSGNTDRPSSLPFPDFTQMQILRQLPGGVEEKIPVNLGTLMDGDCQTDVPLQWGDVVEIPESDHPLNESWKGIEGTRARAISGCLNRTVTVVVKGQSTRVPLYLLVPSIEGELVKSGLDRGVRYAAEKSDAGTRIHHGTCWLSQVLQQSNLLRSSSDLSRVRVRRVAAGPVPAGEWVIDCTRIGDGGDFWLRDGDAIEVPDKSEPAPAGSGAVRVLGEVNRPGIVALETGVRKDIIDAIAACGGFTRNARAQIEFTRDGVTRKLTIEALKAEADPDKKLWLQPGDTIEVKKNLF